MTDPALPHRSADDVQPDERPSIAKLQRMAATGYGWPNAAAIALNHATPVLLEIAAAALAWQDSMWRPSRDGEADPTGALLAALRRVRP